ncbi:MAG: aminotransferase class III-fold pyridoxal phosphate-dependent enzyme [Gaiellales bacterium]
MGEPGSVLTAPPPSFTGEDASRIAAELFDVAGEATPLRSERDQNFLIGGSWVLKLSNAGEDPDVLAMENAAMAHVRATDPSLPVPALREARAGGTIAMVDGHLARLVELMPGGLLTAEELTEAQLRDFGRTSARLGQAFRGFFHPAATRTIQWDLRHASGLRRLIDYCADDDRALAGEVLARWEQGVAPGFAALRAQVVHGDLSLDNALFGPDGSVSGVIDFGDTVHTALLCDLAVALVSTMGGRADPLRAGAITLEAYDTITPLTTQELELLPLFVQMRLATSLVIAAWRTALYPDNAEYIASDSPRFRRLLSKLVATGPEATTAALLTRDPTADLVERRRRVLGPAMQSLTYDRPIHMVSASGVWMTDVEGRRYLDAYNNVPVVGHTHPRVVDAIARQCRLLNTNMRYLHGAAIELAERLLATTPAEIDTCLFVNSGSEANELAWRILTAVTGRGGGVVTEHAYHGVTTATAALSPEEWYAQAPPPQIVRIPAPDTYRLDGGWGERASTTLTAAFAELRDRGFGPGAVVADSGYTSDGIFAPPPEYLATLIEQTRAAGGGFVADEVQAGHGRTGEHLWSFTASGAVPDAVTLGKPMGNGFPVAAVLLRGEIAAAMAERTTYFSTFGGNPVACAAALAVLDVIEEEGVVENARVVGAYLREQLASLAEEHDAVGDVRGRGLMIGVELVSDRDARTPDGSRAARVVNELRELGVLVGRCGKHDNILKIRPPLVFAREHADLLVERLDAALSRA